MDNNILSKSSFLFQSFGSEEDATQNVLVLTKFALTIMDSLQEINNQSFQKFHLRIGKQYNKFYIKICSV